MYQQEIILKEFNTIKVSESEYVYQINDPDFDYMMSTILLFILKMGLLLR